MNRQVRCPHSAMPWHDFGAVTHFEAVRLFVDKLHLPQGKVLNLQTRDADHPDDPISDLEIIVETKVKFLNPRQGADNGTEETTH